MRMGARKGVVTRADRVDIDGNRDGNDGNHHHAGTDAGSSTRSDFGLEQAVRYT
jgi:hypothetical protein